MRVFSADPGVSGAVCLFDKETGPVKIFDMPCFQVKKGKTMRRVVDGHGLVAIFDAYPEVRQFYVELVGPMRQRPGQEDNGRAQQGLASAFSFGRGFGVLEGVAIACGLSITYVVPAVWKRKLALIGQPKDASRKRASELWPDFSGHWRAQIHSGRAESAMVAFWGVHHGVTTKDELPS